MLVLAVGCATQSPPSADASAVVVTPPPAKSPEPKPTPEPETKSDVPDAPWRVSYADGSGNAFEFEQTSTGKRASYTYSPITPERSSSGMYSGGEPAEGSLDAEQVAGLWRRLLQLEAETSLHTEERVKGTGAFRIVTRGGERSFIVSRGELLLAFDAFLAELKAPSR